VVILPPYMRATFKDGAVYADAEDVQNTIEQFIGDPDRYYAQRVRAREYAHEHFSPEAFYARVELLLGDSQ